MDKWKPIEEIPSGVTEAIVYDPERGVVSGDRDKGVVMASFYNGRWIEHSELLDVLTPTMFIEKPSAPISDDADPKWIRDALNEMQTRLDEIEALDVRNILSKHRPRR